jgi:alkylation response protein AidB-like acyl-CoA dehydrogenase
MEFSWSDEQLELFDAIETFARAELNENLIEHDRDGTFNRAGWNGCAAMGVHGLAVPEEYGGIGQDPLTTVGALEHLGYACRDNGLTFSINAHMWTACAPLADFGSEDQKRRYLPGLCSGELIGGNAMSEADSGSDAYGMRTSASKDGDRYILNGSKIYVTNAPIADVLVVFAVTDEAAGSGGITAFLVEPSFPGVSVSRSVEKMGLRTSPMGELFLDDCEVPEANRLGAEGAGAALFTHSMTWERGSILASAVGSMRWLLETSVRYARTRKQFGQPIGKNQLVSTKIVDMRLRLESSRYLLYHAAYQRHVGRTPIVEAALAKLHLSESWVRSCEDAIQIHGGLGYMTEGEIEREMRDAIGSRLYSGTSEIQRVLVSSMLGL